MFWTKMVLFYSQNHFLLKISNGPKVFEDVEYKSELKLKRLDR